MRREVRRCSLGSVGLCYLCTSTGSRPSRNGARGSAGGDPDRGTSPAVAVDVSMYIF